MEISVFSCYKKYATMKTNKVKHEPQFENLKENDGHQYKQNSFKA